jgi:hypothetical protein
MAAVILEVPCGFLVSPQASKPAEQPGGMVFLEGVASADAPTLSSDNNTNNPTKEDAMNYMSETISRTFPNINLPPITANEIRDHDYLKGKYSYDYYEILTN